MMTSKKLTMMYNLSMDVKDPSYLANIYGETLKRVSKNAEILRQRWHEPRITANILKIGSRSINYYESIGLIKDPRDKEGRGWRKFTYVEAVYLVIVRELRRYGIDFDIIKTFYDAYIRNDDSFFTDAILMVTLGYRITIVIEPKCTRILNARELEERDTSKAHETYSSEIRVNLACSMRRVDDLIKKCPLTSEHSLWFCSEVEDEELKSMRRDWSLYENLIMDKVRQVKAGESIEIKRTTNGDILTEHTKLVRLNDVPTQLAEAAVGEYGNVNITMRGGKVVKAISKKSTKL